MPRIISPSKKSLPALSSDDISPSSSHLFGRGIRKFAGGGPDGVALRMLELTKLRLDMMAIADVVGLRVFEVVKEVARRQLRCAIDKACLPAIAIFARMVDSKRWAIE